jgi:hypothetical protein
MGPRLEWLPIRISRPASAIIVPPDMLICGKTKELDEAEQQSAGCKDAVLD